MLDSKINNASTGLHVDVQAFINAMRKKALPLLVFYSWETMAMQIGVSKDTLLRVCGAKENKILVAPTLNVYIKCCAWLGCSLYKFVI